MLIDGLRWVKNPNGTRDLEWYDGYVWRRIDEISLAERLAEERGSPSEGKERG